MLTYNCPTTGQFVETCIETSPSILKRLDQFKLSLWCPFCRTGHQIAASKAFVTEQVDVADHTAKLGKTGT